MLSQTCPQVHRRLFDDDGKGLDQARNEPGQFGDGLIVRGFHYVILDKSTLCHRLLGKFIHGIGGHVQRELL